MKCILPSIIIVIEDEIDVIREPLFLKYFKPEKPRQLEENLIHDLYLEDFIDSDEYL